MFISLTLSFTMPSLIRVRSLRSTSLYGKSALGLLLSAKPLHFTLKLLRNFNSRCSHLQKVVVDEVDFAVKLGRKCPSTSVGLGCQSYGLSRSFAVKGEKVCQIFHKNFLLCVYHAHIMCVYRGDTLPIKGLVSSDTNSLSLDFLD